MNALIRRNTTFLGCNGCGWRATCPIWRSASELHRPDLARTVRVRHLGAGETLVEEGTGTSMVGVVLHGVLRVQTVRGDGQVHVVGLLQPGELFGRPVPGGTQPALDAGVRTSVCWFDGAAFARLVERDRGLERGLLIAAFDEADAARELALLLNIQNRSQRLAAFLLSLDARDRQAEAILETRPASSPRLVRMPISRRDLGAYLGTTPETISRIFHRFADLGTIRLRSTSVVELVDLARLRVLAGETGPVRGRPASEGRRRRSAVGARLQNLGAAAP